MISERALWAMELLGGSFAKALAQAYRAADLSNKAKLERCFKEVFKEYEEWAKRWDREQEG